MPGMTDATGSAARPHRAARLEAGIHRRVERRLRARGWSPSVVPYMGYGGPGWARVLARVLLTPPGTPREALEDGRGWRRFVSSTTSGVPVTVRIGDATHQVTSMRDGYVDVRLPCDAGPGWTTATLEVDGEDPVEAALRIVGADSRLALLSDIDDTVIVTMLPRPLVAFRNAFLVRESARRAVPGMADLYREIVATEPDVFVVYLSTGAWNTAAALDGFLARHGFPPGPLLLTDWGPTLEGWFRSGRAHKKQQLERLFAELPQLRWLLVGDDGQHDPSVYAEAAAADPDRVLGIAIRRLTATQQVAGHGTPSPPDKPWSTGGGLPGDPACGADGYALGTELRRRGILLGRPR
jgi:phosphatidate phosphatase APP1